MRSILTGIGLALLLAAPALAERLEAPGTNISMEVPAGFVASSTFAGFENLATGSSVVVTELPVEGYAQIYPVFSKLEDANRAFAEQGMVVDEIEETIVDGRPLLLLHGTQQVGSLTAEKYIALTVGDRTVMVVVNLFGGVPADEVRAMLTGMDLGSAASIEERLAALPFAVDGQAPFTIPDTLSGNALVLKTQDDPDPSGQKPRIIIAWQATAALLTRDLDAMGRAMIDSTTALGPVEISGSAPTEFLGAEGLVHTGSYERDGERMHLVQYVAISDLGFVRMLATMRASEAADLLPIVAEVAATVRRQ